MKKRIAILAAALLALALLSSCTVKGRPLPEGLEETSLLDAGREIATLLNGSDWQGVYDRLRPASQALSSPDTFQTYMAERLEKAGPYSRETDALATGQTIKDTGEEYGTAVLYCKHEKKNVVYRIAFSTDMELIDIDVTVQG